MRADELSYRRIQRRDEEKSLPARPGRKERHCPEHGAALANRFSSTRCLIASSPPKRLQCRAPRAAAGSRRSPSSARWRIASSILSAPTRTLRARTMPPSEINAASVVPPPISTTMLPDASITGRPAPIAAAIGSSISRTRRGPALPALSWIARRSTTAEPRGSHTMINSEAAFAGPTDRKPVGSLCVDDVHQHTLTFV